MYTMRLQSNDSFAHAGSAHGRKETAAGRFKSRQTVLQPPQQSILMIVAFITLLASVAVSSISGQFPWFVAALAISGMMGFFYPKSTSAGKER